MKRLALIAWCSFAMSSAGAEPVLDSGVASMSSEQAHEAGLRARDARNYEEAARLFCLAAEKGNASGQYQLGTLYTKGQGVPQDYAEALKWRTLAAENGNVMAMQALGATFEQEGYGTPPDLVRAYMWWSLAATAGGKDAAFCASSRDELATKMTRAQIDQARELIREWTVQHSMKK